MSNPLEQFEIKPLMPLEFNGLDISFTNSALFMFLTVIVMTLFMVMSMRGRALVPGRWQSAAEMLYEFVEKMVLENAGAGARKFFPFIFTLFTFILVGNILGLFPYSFTFTSHIIVTFGLALIVFCTCLVIGFARHGMKFLSLFMPGGAPWVLAPLLIPIEMFSYFSRPFSLAIRLFANMLAGHIVLKVFAGFTIALGLFGVAPLLVNSLLLGFELLVACLQAYIFALLSSVYIHDSIYLH